MLAPSAGAQSASLNAPRAAGSQPRSPVASVASIQHKPWPGASNAAPQRLVCWVCALA